MLRAITQAGSLRLAHRVVTSTSRSLSSGEGAVKKAEPESKTEDVEEEEFSLAKFDSAQLLPEVPIKSLDLVKRIDKVEKKGSFTVDMFKGKYDEEFLIYPDVLDNRQENKQIKEQAAMLSVSEMMTIFEAIGASTRSCISLAQPNVNDQDKYVPQQTQVSRAVISLIIKNCLTYWPMFKSENAQIREMVPQKNIIFGSPTDATRINESFGFCWTEQVAELGSLPPQEWLTIGQGDGSDLQARLIQGRKTRVLYDESIEQYLVYYRDKFLSDKYEENQPEDEPNPASDPFVGCSMIHKSDLKLSEPYYDSAGCKYVDIDIDTVVPASQSVFPAQRKDPFGVNIKALGQLATSAVVMGILKDTLKMTYQHLLSSKRGLLDCDIIERKLAGVTQRIFALESMIYYIAGMYDGLKEGFDAHMETTVLKIVTNEYAYEALKDIQDVCGSDMFIISKIQDQINMFDSFLDGNIHNRLYLATMGVIWFARSKNVSLNKLRLAPWYPGFLIKSLLRERAERGDWLTLNADIYGHLHPSLKSAGLNLEYIVKRVKFAAESLCIRYGKDVTAAQSALYKLSQLSIDAFILTAMCARSSKSYCNGSKHSEIDVHLTVSFSEEVAKEVRLYMEAIDFMPINSIEVRGKIINELNIKNGGYYAESPLDPNI